MPATATIAALLIQATLAVVSVESLRHLVLKPSVGSNPPRLWIDVWIPVIVVIPFMFLIPRAPERGAIGVGWLPLAGPVWCGVLAIGVAMLSWRGGSNVVDRIEPRALAIWAGAGSTLLMLGAAHDLTLWMGQFAFALAAVLLWMNSPEETQATACDAGREVRAGLGLLIAATCALGQGAASLWMDSAAITVSAGCMMLAGAVIVASTAALGGPLPAIRAGGWAMTYGFLLSIGLISVIRLVTDVLRVVKDEEVVRAHRIAHGFGAYWFEGLAIAIGVALAVGTARLHWTVRRFIGAVVVLAAAVMAAWRISRLGQ